MSSAFPLPRRHRHLLLGALLCAGLLPTLVWALVTSLTVGSFFSVSLAPIQALLDSPPGAHDEALRQARLYLAQGELARRSLVHLAPGALLLTLALSAAVLAAAAVYLGRRLSRPIEDLTAGMQRLAQGDLSYRIPESTAHPGDELQLLVRHFNRMAGDLAEGQRRLQRAEQLFASQEVARVVAHELKNPLTAMKMAVARLARQPAGDRRTTDALALLQEQIESLTRLTHSFSAFAQLPQPSPRPVDLGVLLHEVCALYRSSSAVPVECAWDGAVRIQADPDQLRRAFGNLLKNAIEASAPENGPVRVEMQAAAGRVRVLISDSGSGIPAALDGVELGRPRRSTKPGGSGLGLPISQKILNDHGGHLRLEPRAGRGTLAVVELPHADEAA